jgi:hypothetical protein
MITEHLKACVICREHVQARRAFFDLIASSEQVALSRDISIEVLGSLQRSRLRLLTGVLSAEAVFAIILLTIFGSSIVTRVRGIFTPASFSDSLFWLVQSVEWLGGKLEAALVAIADAVDFMPLPGFEGLPVFQLSWMHWTGIFAAILFLWVLINRMLIGSVESSRSRFS